jgi:hypothetical protein
MVNGDMEQEAALKHSPAKRLSGKQEEQTFLFQYI